MLSTLQAMAEPAVMQRLTLLLNHVLISEPVALARLRPHAGRCVRLHLEGWPALLPPPPAAAFCITPAGLLDWVGASGEAGAAPLADLDVTVDASNPALLLLASVTGRRPQVEVSGDAALAADASWLFDHLRWDVQDDLARFIGNGPANELARMGGWLARGMREGARRLAELSERRRAGKEAAGR